MKINDKSFVPYIEEKAIQEAVQDIAQAINQDFAERKPVLVTVLNGAFMFASDLMKCLDIEVEISFVKVKSYEGTQSSGKVKQLFGLDTPLEGKDVILLEDIVDTGYTVQHLIKILEEKKPASINIASLLFKPDALQVPVSLKYKGIEIPNKFVVGYGLDYDGYGRQYKDIYRLKE
ncbi:hypoxanthine phosphoribosyltransferase [Porifericola rhodea]|uniref:hypoxanthine phosphoribosyltransferase n=1 Tax=Porifericola rhodea TaxID=930972 RepID=UPI0026658E07|nr:hypoxanthine phosphoribosyltransferase [Porifericola rhodea]WKN29837.1 hypoxanthine phosphoribosyltransferase [Porifericola rhodea]